MYIKQDKVQYTQAQRQRLSMVSMLTIKNDCVRQILNEIPRHVFIDEALSGRAYENIALPIGFSQTISQPEVVAQMTDALCIEHANYHSVLEIGTGCGYQSAILAKLFDSVYTVERIYGFYESAKNRLAKLAFDNIHCYYSDGSDIAKNRTFDAIVLTAAPKILPDYLLTHLNKNGRLVAPVDKKNGDGQELIRLIYNGSEYHKTVLSNVSFVPFLNGKS